MHCTRMMVAALLALLPLVAMVAPATGALLLNELHSSPDRDWDGDGLYDSRDDEWLEIINTGPGDEDLTGVFVRDSTGGQWHYGFSGTLAPGEVLVVLGSESEQWQLDHGISASGLSLNNSGDTIELWRDIAEPRILEVLDMVTVPPHAAGSARSYGRAEGGGDWALFDALNPYSGAAVPGGTGCDPSPGAVNDCGGAVAVEASSFGRVKSLF